MDAHRMPTPHPPQDFNGWLPQALEMLRFVLVSFSTLFIKKKSNLLVVVFLSISCAFTVCKFVGSLLPLCDLVIHTPSLLLHSSVLYRNITLVKATVHPEVRNFLRFLLLTVKPRVHPHAEILFSQD